MASIHGRQKEYQLAIDCMSKAFEVIPEKVKHFFASPTASMAAWYEAIGAQDLSFEAAERAFMLYPRDVRSQTNYIKNLSIRDDSDNIISTLQFLNQNIESGADYTWLARSFLLGFEFDAYDEIGKAAREKGQFKWVLDVMDTALQRVEQNAKLMCQINLPFQMAQFNYRWYDDREEETIKLSEMFLDRQDRQDLDVQEAFATEKRWAKDKLAQLYFDRAVTAFELGDTANFYAQKLKGMAVSVETSSADDYDGFDFFLEDYPSLLWVDGSEDITSRTRNHGASASSQDCYVRWTV